MKRLLFILVIGIVLASCNGWQRVEEEEKTYTVMVKDIGNFTVTESNLEFRQHGIVDFTDVNNRTMILHISECKITHPALPVQQPQRPQVEQKKPAEKPQNK